jgi:hypothetical protein
LMCGLYAEKSARAKTSLAQVPRSILDNQLQIGTKPPPVWSRD